MDFWSAIGDVSAVITVGGAAWQTGKALFKKTSSRQKFLTGAGFKKTLPCPDLGNSGNLALQKKLA